MARVKIKRKKLERLEAAEEVCWTLMIMMGIGCLDIPQDERLYLGGPMEKWVDLGVEAGVIPKE